MPGPQLGTVTVAEEENDEIEIEMFVGVYLGVLVLEPLGRTKAMIDGKLVDVL